MWSKKLLPASQSVTMFVNRIEFASIHSRTGFPRRRSGPPPPSCLTSRPGCCRAGRPAPAGRRSGTSTHFCTASCTFRCCRPRPPTCAPSGSQAPRPGGRPRRAGCPRPRPCSPRRSPCGGGKTLCEILTVAGAMPLYMATRRPAITCPGAVSCGRLFNEEATVSGADYRDSIAVPPPCGPVPAQMSCRLPYANAFQWFASSLT